MRTGLDFVAELAQLLDASPNRRARDPQLPGKVRARNACSLYENVLPYISAGKLRISAGELVAARIDRAVLNPLSRPAVRET